MAAVVKVAHTDEVGRANFAQEFVDGEVPVREERKGDLIGHAEVIDFRGRIADPDPDDFDAAFELGIGLDPVVDLIYSGSLPLTVRSVHTENFDDHNIGIDLRDGKRRSPLHP